MQKNKLFLLILILSSTVHAITLEEQFKTLSDDKKLELLHIQKANYERIFTNKNAAIKEYKEWASWWKGTALAAGCLAIGSLMITASVFTHKVVRE